MKHDPSSARDILLARHAAAQPALDAQAEAFLARLPSPQRDDPASQPSTLTPQLSAPGSHLTLSGLFATLWRELFLPCRGAWAALACIWVALLAFNASSLGPFSANEPRALAQQDTALLALWFEQRRLLVELSSDAPLAPAPQSKAPAPAHPLGSLNSHKREASYT